MFAGFSIYQAVIDLLVTGPWSFEKEKLFYKSSNPTFSKRLKGFRYSSQKDVA